MFGPSIIESRSQLGQYISTAHGIFPSFSNVRGLPPARGFRYLGTPNLGHDFSNGGGVASVARRQGSPIALQPPEPNKEVPLTLSGISKSGGVRCACCRNPSLTDTGTLPLEFQLLLAGSATGLANGKNEPSSRMNPNSAP